MRNKVKSASGGANKLLGSLEQKIMDILWESKTPLKPGDVLAKLKDKYAYTTIMTELKRMADKGLLIRQLAGRVYLYTPVKSKEAFAKCCLCGLFDNLVDSYGNLAISQFVDTISQSKDDLKVLKEYLEKST